MQPGDDGIARTRRGLDPRVRVAPQPRSSPRRALRPSLASAPGEATSLLSIAHGGGVGAAAYAPLAVRVALPQLAGAPLAEVWEVDAPVTPGSTADLRWAATDDLLAGALELPAPDGASLEAATCFAYRELLAVSAELGFPHLLRVWNVVPAINRLDGGLERYRRFCRGRAEAFEGHHGPLFQSRLCASSAVGSSQGDLVVWFLAAKHRGLARENPRQVSAYAYPTCYGPRSPSFARATRCPEAAGGWLLLSGTASIVGHRSLHRGDARRQLAETLDNLEQLVGARGSSAPGGAAPFHALKVYVRHPGDLPAVREELEARVGDALPVLYLQADICREELLLEIEGVA